MSKPDIFISRKTGHFHFLFTKPALTFDKKAVWVYTITLVH